MLYQKNSQKLWTMLVWVIVIAMLLSGCGNSAQSKVYKVGILVGLDYVAPVADGFKEGMAELGYVEGENIVYDVQTTNFDITTYQTVLKKFAADKVDLILVSPTEATLEAKTITQGTDIPVVFCFAFTEGMGIIDSVREPGGNITGVRFPGVDIAVKRFEVLRQISPNAKQVLIPYQRGYPIVAPQIEAIRPLAEAAGITLIELPADNAMEIQAELDKRTAADEIGIDAIFSVAEPLVAAPDAFIALAKFAQEHKILFGGTYAVMGEYGSIFGVSVDLFQTGKLAAPLADKVLNGARAGTIPSVTPDNFIQINFKLAQELGLSVPEGLLKQANEISR